jgi:hypothetical protein
MSDALKKWILPTALEQFNQINESIVHVNNNQDSSISLLDHVNPHFSWIEKTKRAQVVEV